MNTPQNPQNVELEVNVVPTQSEMPPGVPEVESQLIGGLAGGLEFGLTFYTPGGIDWLSNLASLGSNLQNGTVFVGPPVLEHADVTSVELVSTPEPATVIVYLAAIAGLGVRRGVRSWRSFLAR